MDVLENELGGGWWRGVSVSPTLRGIVTDTVPVVLPVVLLTLCGLFIGWRIHVYEYNRGFQSSFHKIHLWQPFSYSPQPRYCNGCRQLISGFLLFRNMGYECQCCQLYSHLSCLLICERSSCKRPGRSTTHQFREGNLENSAVCALCGVVCSSSFSLFGLECLWCRRAFHASCLERAKEARQPIALVCDLGPLCHLVIPPSALMLKVPPKSARGIRRASNADPSPLALALPASASVPGIVSRTPLDAQQAPPPTTANVDVDTKPLVKRVALSARKANDWQLVNFPDVAELAQIHEFHQFANAATGGGADWGEQVAELLPAASNATETLGPETNLEGPMEPAAEPTTTLDAATETAPPVKPSKMKLLRTLVKKSPSSTAQKYEETFRRAQAWASVVVRLHNAVSDMTLLLERTGVFPFIVFVNPKSGGQLGSLILKECYAYLNPWQVVDLSIEKTPTEALVRFQGLAVTGRLRSLACGGDGTVSWVIDSINSRYQTLPSYNTLTQLYQIAKMFLADEWRDDVPSGSGARKSAEVEGESEPLVASPAESRTEVIAKKQLRYLRTALANVIWEPVQIPVAVLPLGTGNDLSKVLNWGANFSTHTEFLSFMRRLMFGKSVPLDMWNLEVYKDTDESSMVSCRTFTNYIDIGIAARIALKFHTLREAHPELFRSRLGNKFLYGEVGVRDYLVDQSVNLQGIEIYCDDEEVDLTKHIQQGGIEGLAVVNIPSFGGGVEPWKGISNPSGSNSRRAKFSRKRTAHDRSHGHDLNHLVDGSSMEEFTESASGRFCDHSAMAEEECASDLQHVQFKTQKMHDGRIELIGFRSLLHLGRVQVGMADSIKIAQGKSFTIRIKNKVPYQIDGEPSTVSHSVFKIKWKCRTAVLLCAGPTNYERKQLDSFVDELNLIPVNLNLDDIKMALEKATEAGEITGAQSQTLLRRFKYISHPQLASF